MSAIARNRMLALITVISLAAVSSAVASQPNALLIAPGEPSYDLPKFGFRSQNIYGVGERVVFVQWGGLAAQLGLEPGDMILSMNGFPLSYHGSWNDALRQAVYNEGWIQLAVRDVRTGFVNYRQTYVGSPSCGPITQYSHVTAYSHSTTPHVVGGGQINLHDLVKAFSKKNNP